MNTLTIPKNLIQNDDLIVLPRKQYEIFLSVCEKWNKRVSEEQDTDEAIAIYKKEKKQDKLKVLKSLSSLR